MELTAAEGRVLGCLIARQPSRLGSDEPPTLSLDDVRFTCNQSDRPEPEPFDDRTVDDALVSLKSKGLARFIPAGRNMGPVRFRHRADERWRLTGGELAVLAVLLLDGPQTAEEVRARLGRNAVLDLVDDIDVEAALDALAGRTPTPFATRVAAPAWGGETLWAEVLTGQPSSEDLHQTFERHRARPSVEPSPGTLPAEAPGHRPGEASRRPASERQPNLAEVIERLTKIERRLAGIEAALAGLRPAPQSRPGSPSRPSSGHESSRMIR